MGCHTWPPAASAPHMGVRATMSGPPSPAPGWHILIHERAWALSGQNYPYQNATINTFINSTSESAPFPPLPKNSLASKEIKKNRLCCTSALCLPTTHKCIFKITHLTHKCVFSPITSHCSWKWYACLSLVGVQPSAPNGSLSDELCVPQVLVSQSSDLLTQNTPNVNRSAQLITNLRMKSLWPGPLTQNAVRPAECLLIAAVEVLYITLFSGYCVKSKTIGIDILTLIMTGKTLLPHSALLIFPCRSLSLLRTQLRLSPF